jgi:hypothetical protein
MEMSGQIHAPAALNSTPIEREAGWVHSEIHRIRDVCDTNTKCCCNWKGYEVVYTAIACVAGKANQQEEHCLQNTLSVLH